ncbi:MAG: hypothetical protein AAF830_13645 [Pseudomonadota bacterium]
MTPRRTLLLIALFVAVTFGSFVAYIIRSLNAVPAAAVSGGFP